MAMTAGQMRALLADTDIKDNTLIFVRSSAGSTRRDATAFVNARKAPDPLSRPSLVIEADFTEVL
jgi:hypothetical protein